MIGSAIFESDIFLFSIFFGGFGSAFLTFQAVANSFYRIPNRVRVEGSRFTLEHRSVLGSLNHEN
jgi:hypothetical protein